jgi:hypothetical protein
VIDKALEKHPQYVHCYKCDEEKFEIKTSFLTLRPISVDRNVSKPSGHAIKLLGRNKAIKEERRKFKC